MRLSHCIENTSLVTDVKDVYDISVSTNALSIICLRQLHKSKNFNNSNNENVILERDRRVYRMDVL